MIRTKTSLIVLIFLLLGISLNLKSQTSITIHSEATLRKSNNGWSEVITKIPTGTWLKVLSKTEGYYKVSYNGEVGYISSIYTSKNKNQTTPAFSNQTRFNSSNNKVWNEYNIKEHWKKNGIKKLEGIYESTGSHMDGEIPCKNGYGQTICYMTWRKYDTKYKVAILEVDGKYKLYYLDGKPRGSEKVGGCRCNGKSYIAPEASQWTTGEVKANLFKTATPNLFKCNWFMSNKALNSDAYITFEEFNYFTLLLSGEKSTYLKLFPTVDENINSNIKKSSGTGFAITSNGLIATNYHVIEGANKIKVRGINNDFSRTYSAKVVVSDKNNDLAILKINDSNFSSLGTVPYTFKTNISSVGENIFVLGYPLRASMGDEVKLTNGIVSSKTGFQGDVSTYQISAPVQPGNSGGPLFNNKGQIIGIINAKHTKAENASYAIKTSYLFNLIDLLDNTPSLPKYNLVSTKALPEKVKLINKFVYIIEIN